MTEEKQAPRSIQASLAAYGTDLLALALALGFIIAAYLWETHSPGGGVWGDGYPNGEQLMGNFKGLERVGFKGLLYDESLYQGGIRAPGLFLYLALWLKALGLSHGTLAMGLSVALAAGGLGLYGALKIGGVGGWGGLLAMALFLGSPETIGNAHVPLQVSLATGAMGLAYWGMMAARAGKKWGAFLLGMGLILALMTRRQMVIILFAPCFVYAFGVIIKHPLRGIRQVFLRAQLIPIVATLVGVAPFFMGGDSGFLVEGMWLLIALGLGLVLSLPTPKDTEEVQGTPPCSAMFVGLSMAAICLPWYISALGGAKDHLDQSGVFDYAYGNYALPLIRFEYLSIILRGLQPIAIPFITFGVIATFTKRGRRAGALPLIGLGVAAATYFTFFHARYVFPLSLWAAALGGVAIGGLGRWGAGIALPMVLLSVIRFGGWMLPLDIPKASVTANASEHIDWHEGDWKQSLRTSGPNSRPYQHTLFTLAPETKPSPMPGLIKRAAEACPRDRTCGFTLLDAPPSVPFAQGGEGFFEMSYHLHFTATQAKLQAWDRIMGTPDQIVIFLWGEDWELNHWRQVHKNVPFAVLDVFQEGSIHGLVLKTLNAAPDGSISEGWRIPRPIRWEDVIPPKP